MERYTLDKSSLEEKLNNLKWLGRTSGFLGAASFLSYIRGYQLSKKKEVLEAKQLVNPTLNVDYYKNISDAHYILGCFYIIMSILIYKGSIYVKRKIQKL